MIEGINYCMNELIYYVKDLIMFQCEVASFQKLSCQCFNIFSFEFMKPIKISFNQKYQTSLWERFCFTLPHQLF